QEEEPHHHVWLTTPGTTAIGSPEGAIRQVGADTTDGIRKQYEVGCETPRCGASPAAPAHGGGPGGRSATRAGRRIRRLGDCGGVLAPGSAGRVSDGAVGCDGPGHQGAVPERGR